MNHNHSNIRHNNNTNHKKDWTGNSNAVFATLAPSNHTETERETNDYYATPSGIVKKLLDKEKFSHNVWECAVGGGHIAEVLKQEGYDVRCTDIIDRGYKGTEVSDFLSTKSDTSDTRRDIITNPPYSMATEFVKHALDISKEKTKIAMFLKIQFLETSKRFATLFQEHPPKKVYVCVNRVNCGKNGIFEKGSSAVCYCWFIWEKGFKGAPTLGWIE